MTTLFESLDYFDISKDKSLLTLTKSGGVVFLFLSKYFFDTNSRYQQKE